jgi:hypothetical protein
LAHYRTNSTCRQSSTARVSDKKAYEASVPGRTIGVTVNRLTVLDYLPRIRLPSSAAALVSAKPSQTKCRNLYPTKTRPDQKIDAAAALMMAIGRVMTDDENARNLGSFLTDLISI